MCPGHAVMSPGRGSRPTGPSGGTQKTLSKVVDWLSLSDYHIVLLSEVETRGLVSG